MITHIALQLIKEMNEKRLNRPVVSLAGGIRVIKGRGKFVL